MKKISPKYTEAAKKVDKDKLYTVMPDGGVGKYCGRLDRENDRIADFPDSDSER